MLSKLCIYHYGIRGVAHKGSEVIWIIDSSMWARIQSSIISLVEWASYQIRKIAGCACAGNAGNVSPRRQFQRKPLVSDPGMHHGTCVTHVPWCMSGSLTCDDGENVPGIPGACAPAILRIWQEAHPTRVHLRATPFPIIHQWSCKYLQRFIYYFICGWFNPLYIRWWPQRLCLHNA